MLDVLSTNVACLEGDRRYERSGMTGLPSVLSRAWVVWCLAELGAFAEGITRGEEGVRMAEAVDHPLTLIDAYVGVGDLYVHKGDFHKAIPALERGLTICQDWNIQLWSPPLAAALGSAYALTGRVAEALPLLEQAVEQAAATRRMSRQARRVAWRSEASGV